MRHRSFVLSLAVAAALASCGGGSDSTSGTVQGLQGPQQVTIVESSSASSLTLPRGVSAVTGSDYETDRTRFWVRDDSMQVLDTVNMILSSLNQTRYWEQTNTGAYLALVEEEGESGQRGNGGPAYKQWTVESTRASNSAPQIVKFWLDETNAMGSDTPAIIYGRLTVTEEPSESAPLGSFGVFFKCVPANEASTSTNTLFEGYMRTVARNDGQSEVEFYNGHGDPDGSVGTDDYAMRERVRVVANRTAGTGRAYAEYKFVQNEGGQVQSDAGEYQLQYNPNYVALRDVANGNALKVLDRNDFDTRVFHYGVYDATTEERVEQLSGFPVRDANGNNGWAGFHGIWFQNNVSLTNGQTLYRRSFQNNSTTPYTLVIVNGKLQKRTRSSITLADVQNEDLDYFSQGPGGQIRIRFTGSDFVKVAERQNGEWQLVEPPVSIASSFTTGQWINCWSQARGNVEFAWPATLSGSAPANVMEMTPVTSDSPELANGDLTLHGYQRLLRANITSNQANFQNSESPYLPDATSVSSGNQTYVFDGETLLLTLGGNPCVLANGVTITQGPGQFGLNCGPLFTSALSSFTEIQNQSVTYEWATGGNDWNQLRTLKDANNAFVDFEPPLRLTYVHSESGSQFNGRTFFLQWDGSNLGGLPYEESQQDHRWYPLLNIPSATTLTAGGTSYKIKQLEGEQIMVEVGSPSTVYAAQGFDLDAETITAPTLGNWQDPAVGTKPTINAAPLYVAGVRQGS